MNGASEETTRIYYRRNVIVLVLFEVAWGLGMPFTLYPTMVPAYLTVLAASKFLIGAMQALWTICTPIQILSAHFHAGRKRTRNVMIIYMTAVGLRLIHDIIINLSGGILRTTTLQFLFAAATLAFVLFIVYGQPLFFGLMTENIPREKRGRLYGLRTFGLGVGGLAMGVIASRILARIDAPRNYQLSFLIGDGFLFLSCFMLLFLRDETAVDKHESFHTLFVSLKQKLRTLLDEPNYRIFLLFHVLNVVAINIAAFIIPYAKERLGFLDSQVGALSLVFLATGAVFGFFIGRLADKYGYRMVAMTQALLLILFFAIVISMSNHLVIYIAYMLYSLVNMSLLMVLVNMSAELCPGMNAVDLTALGTTVILPVVALVSPVMGMVIDRTGDYFAVFMTGLVIALVALMGFALIVKEPRRGRLYIVKQMMVR
ncbi:MAG: MFS transporter [Spirochaetales bacterium]|nr:MFS transporter [Spirochaetales bacterium]